jgi:hypothetical protein
MRLWRKAEADISSRPFLYARPRCSLAMPKVPQEHLYGETSFGLLARVSHSGICKYAEVYRYSDSGYGG